MPYREHEAFRPPENDNTKVWRYMPLMKFLNMLETEALFFARADVMREQDGFEGRPTLLDTFRFDMLIDLPYDDANKHIWKMIGIKSADEAHIVKRFAQLDRKPNPNSDSIIFLNCWHVSEDESDALWKIYSRDENGVAITSTFGNLKTALARSKTFDVQIGLVEYIDYSQVMPGRPDNMMKPFLLKRHIFKHENELRLILLCGPERAAEHADEIRLTERGAYLNVHLTNLIEKVYVSPSRRSLSVTKSLFLNLSGTDPQSPCLSASPPDCQPLRNAIADRRASSFPYREPTPVGLMSSATRLS